MYMRYRPLERLPAICGFQLFRKQIYIEVDVLTNVLPGSLGHDF